MLHSLDIQPHCILRDLWSRDVRKILAVKNSSECIVVSRNDVLRYDSDSGKRLPPQGGFFKSNGRFLISDYDGFGAYDDIHFNPTQSLLYVDAYASEDINQKKISRKLFCINTRTNKILYEKFLARTKKKIIAFHPKKSELFLSSVSSILYSETDAAEVAKFEESGLYDQWTGKRLPFFKTDSDTEGKEFCAASYSPQGYRFALAYDRDPNILNKIFIYDTTTRNLMGTLEADNDGTFRNLYFSPCGKYLLADLWANNDLWVNNYLYDVEKKSLVKAFSGKRFHIPEGKPFSDSGAFFVLGEENPHSKNTCDLVICDTKTGEALRKITSHYGSVRFFSDDLLFLTEYGYNNTIHINFGEKCIELPESKLRMPNILFDENSPKVVARVTDNDGEHAIGIYNVAQLIIGNYKKNNFLSLKHRSLLKSLEFLARQRAGKEIDKKYLSRHIDKNVDTKQLFYGLPEYLIKALILSHKIDKNLCL